MLLSERPVVGEELARSNAQDLRWDRPRPIGERPLVTPRAAVELIPDEPLPLEPARFDRRTDRPTRRAMSLVTVAWVFGSVWATATGGAPMTLFAQSLGASAFQFGLLSALPFIASLMSMPASALIERTGQRKRIFLWGNYFNRLLWVPIALLPFFLVSHGIAGRATAMTVFLVMMLAMHASGAVAGPAWVSWMADI